MNSRDDFDRIYSQTFAQNYTLSFCLCASHNIAQRVVSEVFNLFYEENLKFKSLINASHYLLSQTNHQTFKYLDGRNKPHLYLPSLNAPQDESDIQNNKNFYVFLIDRALTSKALKEVYVMRFFLSLGDEEIAQILKTNTKAVRANLNRARMLVSLEYEKINSSE